jgi:NAD(P)-dependent dehydrogenase (short-subunit alcohol dehydrogenase family)
LVFKQQFNAQRKIKIKFSTFSREGAKVVCVDFKETEEFKKLKNEFLFISCDISNSKSVQNMIQQTGT